jgi:hypothetical protein
MIDGQRVCSNCVDKIIEERGMGHKPVRKTGRGIFANAPPYILLVIGIIVFFLIIGTIAAIIYEGGVALRPIPVPTAAATVNNRISYSTPTPNPTTIPSSYYVSQGVITGTVYDQNRDAIPDADVTILSNGQIFNIPENPQLTNDGRTSAIGSYLFDNVPDGQYTVTGEKDGHSASAIATIDQNGAHVDIYIQGYSYIPASTPYVQ